MILSDKDLRERIIKDPHEAQLAREWWEKGQWDKIGNKILITRRAEFHGLARG